MKFGMKLSNELFMNEIYEGIPHITRVIVVNRKVKEIELHPIVFQLLQKQLLCVFIGNVPDHQGCPLIIVNIIKIDFKFRSFFICDTSLFSFNRLIVILV